MRRIARREFLQAAGAVATAGAMPAMAQAGAAAAPQRFSFACLSDADLQWVRGAGFAAHSEQSLRRAIDAVAALSPRPDFIVFGGDLAASGKAAELDHGARLLSALPLPVHAVIGDQDYYRDLGAHWARLFGAPWRSFDHKGAHFVVLNSVLAPPAWCARWSSGQQRLRQACALDNPDGVPFGVGEEQRAWLARDLAGVSRDTPLVVLTHAPLRQLHRGWNFWTEDAAPVQALLAPFESVTVLHGHVRQMMSDREGNIAFHSMLSTAEGWAYQPDAAPGWQLFHVEGGRVTPEYRPWEAQLRLGLGLG